MKRAAIYARFSSEKQNERSCSDQIDLCRAWAERQGDIIVVAEYRDEAVSGASMVNRLGLGRMMRDARDRAFDVVVCEHLDRLSRDQADLPKIRRDLTFLEIGIRTVADGEVGAIQVGLRGLMGELFLADLAQKTRRGLRARVVAGAAGGGRSYGYAPVDGKPGELVIVEREAAIVRRIFAEYVAGRTPRAIVADLNRDHIPGPRGGRWNASTLNGSAARDNGVLRNRLYAGEIVWNRQRFIKDPATGNRVSRANDKADRIVVPAPQLRIVEPELFEAAQTRKAERAQVHPVHTRQPAHLLSGLVRCACCGASFTIINRDRLGCAGRRERGDCSNTQTITREELEDRVLAALHRHLASPQRVETFVRAYHAERQRLAATARSQQGEKAKRLAALERTITRGIDAILDGTAPAGLGLRIKGLEAEAEILKADLDAARAELEPIALHPAAAQRYARLVADLRAHLAGMAAGAPSDAVIAQVRKLLDRIEVGPSPTALPARSRKKKEPGTVTVHGLFAELLSFSDPSGRAKVVAGARNSQSPTFRFAA